MENGIYFDALGYMLSSTWVDGRYYVKDNGKMAHSEWIEMVNIMWMKWCMGFQ